MMDNLAIRAAEDYAKAGYPVGAAAILLCELDGTAEEVSEGIAQVQSSLVHSPQMGRFFHDRPSRFTFCSTSSQVSYWADHWAGSMGGVAGLKYP